MRIKVIRALSESTEVKKAEESVIYLSLAGADYLGLINQANRLFDDNKKQEALELLSKGIASTNNPRKKWILKFNLVKLCVKSNRLLLADTLLTSLKTEIESVKHWEPDLYSDLIIEEFNLQPLLRYKMAYFQAALNSVWNNACLRLGNSASTFSLAVFLTQLNRLNLSILNLTFSKMAGSS